MQNEKTRNISLDLVRIFAAFWVLGFHWFAPSNIAQLRTVPSMDWARPIYYDVFEWGFLGVDIFFILSGSLIAKSAIDNEWFNFAKHRFVRLFPAYFLVALLSLFLYPLATNYPMNVEMIFSLTGLQFWIGGPKLIAAGWTLPIEIGFYFLITLALLFYNKKRNFGSLELRNFLNIWLLLHILSISVNFQPAQIFFVTSFAPYFIFGAALSLIKSRGDLFSNIFTLSISFVLILRTILHRVESFPDLRHKFFASFLLLICMSGIIIYSNKPVKNPRTNLLIKSVPTLSRMTYPIYLLHLEVGLAFVYFFVKAGLTSGYAFIASLLLVLVISYVIVRFFEPFCKRIIFKYFVTRGGAQD
jgi:peptidoglycan/LPS O-acetylase OafA/YrhL